MAEASNPAKRVVVVQKKVVRTTTTRTSTVRRTTSSTNSLQQKQQQQEPLSPIVHTLIRTILLDVPILILVCLLMLTIIFQYTNQYYFFPLMKAKKWTPERAEEELTYYDMVCSAKSILTAADRTSLEMTSTQSREERLDLIRMHGAGVFSNLINPHDAAALRNFVLTKNRQIGNNIHNNVDVVGVIENEHRWSFAFGANEDTSIPPALRSIATNPIFKETLEDLLGTNPALIELSTITAAPGARDQGWHFDTAQRGDGTKFGRSFVDLYSLLIPLQDTTADMGATAVCPGTHHCTHMMHCEQYGFQAVNNRTGVWNAGDGLLFNSYLGHHGAAYKRQTGPHRVALVISFIPRPDYDMDIPSVYSRLPPLAAGYNIRWDMMGFTLRDLEHVESTMSQPWTLLRSLGIYNKNGGGGVGNDYWGWTYFQFACAHMGNLEDPPQVVLMPYIKILPMFLLGEAQRDNVLSPWQVFIQNTIQQVLTCMVALNIMALTGCVWLIQQKFINLRRTVLRLVIIYGSIAVIGLRCVSFMNSSQWANDIRSRNIATSPFNHPLLEGTDFSESYIQNLACPTMDDIMIGTRLKELSNIFPPNAFLDYHHGNRRWKSLVEAYIPTFILYRGLPSVFQEATIDCIVERSTVNNYHRFLEQNSFGDWRELTREASKQRSHELLWTMIASPQSTPCAKIAATPICQTSNSYIVKQILTSSDYTSVTGGTNMLRIRPKLQQVYQNIPFLIDSQPNLDFAVGDHIEARMTPTSRKWMRGYIVQKHHNRKYSIQYDVDLPENNGLDPVDASMIRSIKPSAISQSTAESNDILRWKSRSISKMDDSLKLGAFNIYKYSFTLF